jgi:DNA-binding XRE family transcriptional regulator
MELASDMIDPQQVTEARRALGAQLALLREAAGYTQWELAPRVLHSRSTVANVETGHQLGTRDFWKIADQILHADGALLRGYEQVQALIRRQRTQAAVAVAATREALVDRSDGTTIRCEAEPVESAGSSDGTEAPRDIRRRRREAGMSNVDEAKLDYLEAATRQLISANETELPALLAPQVRGLRRHVDELMKGHQHPPQRARLYEVAVYLSGLLGALALDMGHQRSAGEYGLEAYELAGAVGQPQLLAWARATQSLIAYYGGRYHDALTFARDGQRWAGGGPQSVRLAINGEARALARMGDVYGVDKAVDQAFTTLAAAPTAVSVSPSLAIGGYCPARTAANAATAYLAFGAHGRVVEYAAQALVEFDRAGLRGPQALSRLDLATAALMSDKPEVEHGCALAKQALSVAADHHFESVNQRAQEFLAAVQPWVAEAPVREVAELVHAHAARPALEA